MAGIKDIVDIFKTVATADAAIEQVHYGKSYEINGLIRASFPLILIDCMPDFTTQEGRNTTFKATKKEYRIRIAIYDKYQKAEQSTKLLDQKQQELQIKFENYLGEVARYMLNVSNIGAFVSGRENNGFFGNFTENNQALVMISETIIVSAPISCTGGTYTYS